MPSSTTPSFTLLSMLFLSCLLFFPSLSAAAVGEAGVGKDMAGNLLLNSSANASVLVNGMDVESEIAMLRSDASSANARIVALENRVFDLVDALDAIEGPPTRVFVMAGSEPLNYSVSTDSFNGASWTKGVATMAEGRWLFGAAAFNRSIYAVGGLGLFSSTLSSVEMFDGKVWSNAPPLRTARFSHFVVNYRGLLYAGGGNDIMGERLASVEVFNGVAWSYVAPMLAVRAYTAGVSYKRRIFAIGGFNDDGPIKSVESFDGYAWASAKDLPAVRNGHNAAVYNGFAYVLGGDVNNRGVSTSVLRFDGVDWSDAPAMFTARSNFAVVAFNGLLYSLGSTGTLASMVRVDTFNGTAWTTVQPMPTTRAYHCAVAL